MPLQVFGYLYKTAIPDPTGMSQRTQLCCSHSIDSVLSIDSNIYGWTHTYCGVFIVFCFGFSLKICDKTIRVCSHGIKRWVFFVCGRGGAGYVFTHQKTQATCVYFAKHSVCNWKFSQVKHVVFFGFFFFTCREVTSTYGIL